MLSFYSHPDTPLERHLREVAQNAKELLDHPALKKREYLSQLAYLAGIAHDFGKFTSFFQKHLQKEKVGRGLHHHGMISALFAAHISRCFFPEDPLAWLVVYLAVHRHHGPLYAPKRTWPSKDHVDVLKRQWEDLTSNKEAIRKALKQVWEEEDAGFLDLSFEEAVEKLIKPLKVAYRDLSRGIPSCEEGESELKIEHVKYALYLQLVYSALISADKFSASSLDRPERLHIDPELVDKYIEKLPSSSMAGLRRKLQDAVRQSVEDSSLPCIFTLTAPTGSGKTLAAFRAALQIREKLAKRWKIPSRIVYALPFINLIEQVEEVIRQVLENHPDYRKSPEKLIISHHHLADVRYQEESEEKPLQEALLLVEDWESEVVVTTFVQIFHTLFGYANRWLKKLHNLIGAILILDEPQQFPPEYWKAIGWIISMLRNELGVTTIFMTATQPRILEEVGHKELVPQELIKNFQVALNRYEVTNILDEDAFLEELERELRESHSVLIVVNTIRTSLELWEKLKDFETKKHYLSTNIISLHRRKRIEEIKEKLSSNYPILVVATQVVEAGVDLDFDVVFREISPLDSLIQAAGRCNREGRKKKGKVYRFFLERSIHRGSLVYGRVATDVAQEVWKGNGINESDLVLLLEKYYELLVQRRTDMPSKCLWERYAKLLFFDPKGLLESLKDYPLIAPRSEVSVLIMLSEEDEVCLEEIYRKVFMERDISKRQEAYLQSRFWLHERLLKLLPERALSNLPPLWKDTEFRWVPFGNLKEYYREDIGFIWREEDLTEEFWVL